MLKDEILYETPVSDEKRCSVCGNWFIPNRKFRVYCSEECQKPGNTRENTKNRRKNRNIKNPINNFINYYLLSLFLL